MTSILIRRLKDTRQGHAQRKGYVRIQREDSHLQAKKKASVEHRWHLDFGLLASRSLKKINFSFLSHSVCGIFVTVVISHRYGEMHKP